MNILAVDTTKKTLFVAWITADKIVYRESHGLKKHNAELLPFIEEVLEEAGAQLSEADYFAAVQGPGSFTGIRVGCSVVNAFASIFQKPCLNINAFQILAYTVNEAKFLTLIDAGHGLYYGAEFTKNFKQLTHSGIYTEEEIGRSTLKKVFQTEENDPNAYRSVLFALAENNEITPQAVPLYLRKSQAERMADGD